MGPRQNDELETGRREPRQQLWSMQQRNDGAQLQDAMRPEDAVSIRCASVLLLRVSSAWSAPAGVCQVVDCRRNAQNHHERGDIPPTRAGVEAVA